MIIKEFLSPNFSEESIDTQFIIIHYTGGSKKRAHSLFMDKQKKVSCHFLITENGEVIKYVRVDEIVVFRAWHAGISFWPDFENTIWTDMNSYSIGIELENLNGNLINYSRKQLSSLKELLFYLFDMYPHLNSVKRILGHEDVAGFRGKCDPGLLFPWNELYKDVFHSEKNIFQKSVCPRDLAEVYMKFLKINYKTSKENSIVFWHAINASMEKAISILNR